MQYSYWEKSEWFSDIDYTIIGSGITGLNCALALRKKYPESRIRILERGTMPQGASTKNAGFASFGSISELLDDLNHTSEEDMVSLVEKRWNGLQMLRKNIGDKNMEYYQFGGQEVFPEDDPAFFERCKDNLTRINTMLRPVFGTDVYALKDNIFGFENTGKQYIFTPFEGQINTGKMMQALLRKCVENDILILPCTEVEAFEDLGDSVQLQTRNFDLVTRKLFLATNGFSSRLFKEDIVPARAQVLITSPIKNLHIKGTFHLDKGYYYFRNVGDRILLGGGRNLDPDRETTMEFGETDRIQNRLDQLLKTVILPGIPFETAHRWSGIMGMGKQKIPIIRALSDNVYCGIRLGGIGISIGTWTGNQLAALNRE